MYSRGPQAARLRRARSRPSPARRRPRRSSPGCAIGHLHLHVGDVDRGLAFYRDVIGFGVEANLGSPRSSPPAATTTTSASTSGAAAASGLRRPHTAGMRHWTVELEHPEEVDAVRARAEAAGVAVEPAAHGFLVRDPWANALLIEVTS